LNGLLSSIAMVYIWRDKLVLNLPLVHNGGLEFGAGFVVKDLEIEIVPTVGEAAHDGVVGGQSVFVGPVNIRGTEDCITMDVEGNGDVLVAAASSDGESSSVVGVELGKREVHGVELVSGDNAVGLWLGSLSGLSVVGVSGMASGAKRLEDVDLGLVEHRPWHICLRLPLLVALEEGQCFIAL
jgi:hypothetical protein